MTDRSAHGDPYERWDAAYVLGALGPAERREYAAHLAGCEACRTAVAELAALPGLLASVPADVAPADDAGDVVPFARVAAAARRSRRRRRAGLVAAAAVIAVGGVLTGSALSPGPEAGPTTAPTSSGAVAGTVTLELAPVGDAGMWADLVATPTSWGTSLEWSCRYERQVAGPAGGYSGGPEPVTYELVLVDRTGARVVAATWTTADQEATGLGASSAWPLSSLERIEIGVAGRAEPLAATTL